MTFDSCGNCRKAMAGPSLQLFQALLSFFSPSDARIGKTCECTKTASDAATTVFFAGFSSCSYVMKRCPACLLYLSSTAFVTLNFHPSTCERSCPCWPRDMLRRMSVV